MASYESAKSITLTAGSDFTGDIYKLVAITAEDTCDVVSGLTDIAVGVIAEEVTSGRSCGIVLLQGRVKVQAGGNITVGQILVPATDGQVTGTAIGSMSADVLGVGIALEAAADGQNFEMLAMPIAQSGA